jgi:hypothetical protein
MYMSSRIRRVAVLAASAVVLLGCNEKTTAIKTLLDDPARFDGQTVRIAGEVREAAGALGFGAYQVRDATGTIPVVSEGGGAPTVGARVGVEGTFRSAYTFGTESGAVLVEKRRYTP